ncbi:MAG: repair protein SbcD/Mre11 [Solirubrobacteraceae bacterium]|jgi:exonuclease SbcD|nr:repair protein SbcD/Mre11 [Solirubrobacteraceae bacterium]
MFRSAAVVRTRCQVPSAARDTFLVMRFLHTADWHLGRSFHGESLLDAQAAAIDHVVTVAREAAVDAVVVAGDVYDRALPPVDAVRLADEALRRLSEVCPVVVISGNHDSAPRLGFGSALLARAGVHVRTVPVACGDPVVLGGTCFYPIPYLEPDLVRGELGCAERGHGAVVGAAMARVRADLAARPDGTRAVVVAHAFVAGAEASESERDLAVGGAGSVAPAAFAGVDYVALGHMHGPQRVGDNGRYAGSPLAFSFSEARHAKSLAIVDLDGLWPQVELVPCPVPRPLATLTGTLDELLADPAHAGHEAAWVQATLTDPVRPHDAMDRLRRRFPHAVVLVFDPQGAGAPSGGSYAERLHGLDDAALVASFVHDVRGRAAGDEEIALLQDALTAGRVAELSA